MSDPKKRSFDGKAMAADSIPKIRYDSYFRMFGMISRSVDQYFKSGAGKMSGTGRFNRMYCRLVCVMLWFFAIRTFVLMFIWDRNVQVMLGDLTGFWNEYRLYYLMPQLFIALHTAITMTIWQAKEADLAWLVPFASLRQMQSNNNNSVHSNYRPAGHRIRIYAGILFDLVGHLSLSFFLSLSFPFRSEALVP